MAPELAVKGDVKGLDDSQVAAGIMLGDMLAFGSMIERAMEVFLVTLLGVVLIEHWDWRAVLVASALFFLSFAPSASCCSRLEECWISASAGF